MSKSLIAPKHAFVATNPCHVYDLACALNELGYLDTFYSGYPEWRLNSPSGFPLQAISFRTLITYGLQRMPEKLRPPDDSVFRWQDSGFDRAVAKKLKPCGFLHGIPGQCLETFRKAKTMRICRILNHASGPLQQQRALVEEEYHRVGLNLEEEVRLPQAWLDRLSQEMELANIHLVASNLVKSQLMYEGVSESDIWVVPYGANETLFPKRTDSPSGPYKICFAGRQSLRKGIHYLLKAVELVGHVDWELHFFGMKSRETVKDFDAYKGKTKIYQHGSIGQKELGVFMKGMSVLVLPSVEEAFGLVVVQALNAGVPCLVSDRVGAKDLIVEGKTGAVVPFGDVSALAQSLDEWSNKRINVLDTYPWSSSAERLIELSSTYEERLSL